MAELVDYNGNNIEPSLLVTSSSPGLISSSNNTHLEYLYNNRGQFGGCIKTDNIDQDRVIYKYRIYYELGVSANQKIPYILLLSNNNDVSVFSGVFYSMNGSLSTFTPTKIFNNPNPIDVTAKFLKYEDYILEVQFTANYGDWSTCSLIVPGFRVEAFD